MAQTSLLVGVFPTRLARRLQSARALATPCTISFAKFRRRGSLPRSSFLVNPSRQSRLNYIFLKNAARGKLIFLKRRGNNARITMSGSATHAARPPFSFSQCIHPDITIKPQVFRELKNSRADPIRTSPLTPSCAPCALCRGTHSGASLRQRLSEGPRHSGLVPRSAFRRATQSVRCAKDA